MDITDDDQKAYSFAPIYGDMSTAFQCHMISGVVCSSSNKLQSMFVDYVVTQMGCFDDYSNAAPHSKTMRGNGINNFLLQVAQCIIFNQTKFVTVTLISKARLK